MKFNIVISLILMACTLSLTACNTVQQDKTSTTNPATESTPEFCTSSTEINTESTDITESTDNTTSSTEDTTDTNFDCYKIVDDALSELCTSEEYLNATEEEQTQLALSTLQALESKGFIVQNSIVYNETSSNSIEFKYANGALGGFLLKEFHEKIN